MQITVKQPVYWTVPSPSCIMSNPLCVYMKECNTKTKILLLLLGFSENVSQRSVVTERERERRLREDGEEEGRTRYCEIVQNRKEQTQTRLKHRTEGGRKEGKEQTMVQHWSDWSLRPFHNSFFLFSTLFFVDPSFRPTTGFVFLSHSILNRLPDSFGLCDFFNSVCDTHTHTYRSPFGRVSERQELLCGKIKTGEHVHPHMHA